MLKILDCTLRDGGYYTNWDFSADVVDAYIDAMNQLPIDYLEVGYRNNPSEEYLGKFGYSPISVLKHIKEKCSKKIVVMLNEKNTTRFASPFNSYYRTGWYGAFSNWPQ